MRRGPVIAGARTPPAVDLRLGGERVGKGRRDLAADRRRSRRGSALVR
jgi:hypothetical protein